MDVQHIDANSNVIVKKRRNQCGEIEGDENHMTVQDWDDQWQSGIAEFHIPTVNPFLEKYYDRLTKGRTGLRFYLPLCGKSVDMLWLAERGHHVVGLEAVELACKQFFEENKIPYETHKLKRPPGKLFKSKLKDLDIKLYCTDYFESKRDLLGTFDCVWDRGSFVAINPEERESYAKVMLDLITPNTEYLLHSPLLDHEVFTGPPHCVTKEDIDKIFGPTCDVEFLMEKEAMGELQRQWGVTYFIMQLRLLHKRDKKVKKKGCCFF